MVDGGKRDVAPAARTLRRPEQVLGREHAEGLPDSRPAHPELPREERLVGKPLPGRQLAGHDQLAKLVGNLLVRLANPPDRHWTRLPLDGSQQPVESRLGLARLVRLDAHDVTVM